MENGKINGDSIMNFTYESVDENFIDLLKIQLVEGRNFSSLNQADSANAVIVNEAFVKKAGWKKPLGQEVKMMDESTSRVIGVIKDYNYESLKKAIEPQLLSLAFASHSPRSYQHQLVRIRSNSESSSIPSVEKTFKELFPMHPYRYQFYNDINLLNYEAESKWKKVILLSALVTISIAGIGLFGLSILTAESRYKEIGIRKVLGATVHTIVFTLYKGNLALISLALLIAMPAAYYANDAWLRTYPFRTEPRAEIFLGAALFVLLIASATLSYKIIKTALLNPADSLRTE
jgi:putative ABC transport system permease protein